jgi:acetyl esterase/lipase
LFLALALVLLSMAVPVLEETSSRKGARLDAYPKQEVVRRIHYAEEDPGQVLDLYLPDPSLRKAAALLVFNHGSGEKTPLVRWFAEEGYPVLFVHVRRRMAYPFPVRDAFCALAWAHARGPELGVDPSRLVAVGHSGGAILAAHLGAVDDRDLYLEDCPHVGPPADRVRGVVSIAGIFDYRTEEEFGASHNAYTPRYFGGSKEDLPEVWAEASPGSWVDGSEPPFLLLHGTADEMVLPAHSERWAGLLREVGVEIEYVPLPGADHDSVLASPAFRAMEGFIERVSG